MRAGQRESGYAVIERCRVPARRRMTIRTIRRRKRRTRGRVDRIVRALPRRQVALRISAIRRRNLQCVIIVDVAGRTSHIRMPIGQQESRRTVIEFPVRPFRNRMARCAGGSTARKSRRDVIRHAIADVCRTLPRSLVASHAIRRVQRVVVIDMARRAGRWRRRHVRPHQREAGQAVVKSCRIPTSRRMAVRAVGGRKRRTRGGVHRVIRLLPGRQMALRVSAVCRGDL